MNYNREIQLNKISYSQYSVWANCPWAWKLKYVDGHRLDDSTIHTMFGTAMHEVIQDWLKDYVYEGKDSLAKGVDLTEPLKQRFMALFQENTVVDDTGNKTFLCDKQTLMQFYSQGCQILSYVQQYRNKLFPAQNIKLIGIEYPISVEIRSGITFEGYIDIVTQNELTGKITIYDLKTSTSGWKDYQKKDPVKLNQILLYKKFISEQFSVPLEMVGTEYIILKREIVESSKFHVPRVSSFEPSNGKPSVNRAWGSIEEFLSDCFDGEGNHKIDTVKATPSKSACKYCVFGDNDFYCAESFYKSKSTKKQEVL